MDKWVEYITKYRWLVAGIFATLLLVAAWSAADGYTSRKAAKESLALVKQWKEAYDRDTKASQEAFAEKMKPIIAERNALRKKLAEKNAALNAPWRPPSGNAELADRFKAMGFEGRIKK